MRVIVDIEANSLNNPTKVWLVICKDVESGALHTFRNLTDDEAQKEAFKAFIPKVTQWIGHNIIEYDVPVLHNCLSISIDYKSCLDTLILSRLVNYSRPGGHSLAQYGEEQGLPKLKFNDWTKWSQEMEDYCVRDVEINLGCYNTFLPVLSNVNWHASIALENRFQLEVNNLHNNGFGFNTNSARLLLDKVSRELGVLDEKILGAFPPKEMLIREFVPKATKFGTIAKPSIPRILWERIHNFEIGKTYRHTKLKPFNPSSHKQLIEVLNEAGWQPEHRTKTHINTERELSQVQRGSSQGDREGLRLKLDGLRKTGWQINEHNLGTLPDNAPEGARLLAKRILLESRRRTLTEWLGLVEDDGRIRGRFIGLGAWTHRMAHQKPNTANIPSPTNLDGSTKLLGKEMRELWIAPNKRKLVGVDAEGIQLRIFAHYIDDADFTRSLVEGKKDDKTDPHSLNQRILGGVCKTRQAAKRFIYALLLGGGINKLASILECSVPEAKQALDRVLQRYTGFAKLKREIFPKDAKRGYFIGLDGRCVPLPGDSNRDREHLAMSGYLQNGEAIIVKTSAIIIAEALREYKEAGKWQFVNIVHDELISETDNRHSTTLHVAKVKADAIRIAGERLGLKCPLAGSYWNDDKKEYTIGRTWYDTH